MVDTSPCDNWLECSLYHTHRLRCTAIRNIAMSPLFSFLNWDWVIWTWALGQRYVICTYRESWCCWLYHCLIKSLTAGGGTIWEWPVSAPSTHCVTQLMLYTGEKLSSPIFWCLSVCVSGIGNTWPNLHFFQYMQAYKHFTDPIQYIKA